MTAKGARELAANATPVPPLWRAPRRWPGADTAHRGADMCRQALGIPPKHTLPVGADPEPEPKDGPQ